MLKHLSRPSMATRRKVAPSETIVATVILIFLFALGLAAQSPDGPFPVKAVVVKGNQILKAEQVVAAAGIAPGQSVRVAEMDKAMQRLVDCGYFDRVSYRYEPRGDQGYTLEWEVVEVTVFYPIRFEDIPGKVADAKAILAKSDSLFGEQIPATQAVLRRYEDALNLAFAAAEPEDRIRAQLIPDDKGELVALFRPRRPAPSVYQVDFRGNKLLRGEDLRPVIAAAATGLVYKESDFRELLNFKIRPLYEARGRLKVSFPEIQIEKAAENKGINVMVTVVEGEEYNLGEIRFQGDEGRAENWLRVGGFRQGVTANMGEVDEGRRRMEAAIKRNGFLDAKVIGERSINEERKTVDMDFSFEPGAQYSLDKLEIKGLDIISEPELRKIWRMKPGSPFNPEYPDAFLNKVREDGVFDNLGDTRSAAEIDRDKKTVSVTLFFKGEAPKPDPKQRNRSPF